MTALWLFGPLPPADGADLVLNEYNAVAGSQYLAGGASDVFWGRRQGNGRDWFELAVVTDHLDIRGWQIIVTNDSGNPTGQESFRLQVSDHEVWSDLRSGTIVTFSEQLGNNVADYWPELGRWWLNVRANPGNAGTYVSVECVEPACDPADVTWKVSNLNWQILILDSMGAVVYGPAGEGAEVTSTVGVDEIYKLEDDPGPTTTPASSYNDGTSSSFGQPNIYGAGTQVQNFDVLRSVVPYSELSSVRINEVYSHSDPGIDWMELYNPTSTAVDIGGWYLSDNPDSLTDFQIPAGTVIPADGYLVFYESDLPFAFSSACGDEIVLSVADAMGMTGERDYVEFGAVETGVTFGRVAGVDGFVRLSVPTHAADNSTARVGPVVINEIMYNPVASTLGGDGEFVEIYNAGTAAVSLYTDFGDDGIYPWRLTGGVGFDFPIGTIIESGGYIVVVRFDPQVDSAVLAAFKSLYSLDAGVTILGPYSGELGNFSDTVRLRKPDSPEVLGNTCGSGSTPETFAPQVIVDEVTYSDFGLWPEEADGSGSSLERADPQAVASSPGNWAAGLQSSATPGSRNSVLQPPSRYQQKCIGALNKNFAKVAKIQGKGNYGCIKDAARDRLQGLSIADCLTADRRGKLASVKSKTQRDFDKSCTGVDRYGQSHYPRFAATDVTTVNAAAEGSALGLISVLFGDDLGAGLITEASDRYASKCQLSVLKSAQKCLDTTYGVFNKCKKIGLKAESMVLSRDLAACVGADSRAKIARSCAPVGGKIAKDLDRKCEAKGVVLASALVGCATSGVTDTAACLASALACRTCLALNAADGISADCDLADDSLANSSCN